MGERSVLTGRETELLRRLSRGLSNQEIARQMSITVGTTKGHLHRIFRKLDVRNRTAAVAKARELGLL
jgi:LuxR family maltose regulon positive regulatory protein